MHFLAVRNEPCSSLISWLLHKCSAPKCPGRGSRGTERRGQISGAIVLRKHGAQCNAHARRAASGRAGRSPSSNKRVSSCENYLRERAPRAPGGHQRCVRAACEAMRARCIVVHSLRPVGAGRARTAPACAQPQPTLRGRRHVTVETCAHVPPEPPSAKPCAASCISLRPFFE